MNKYTRIQNMDNGIVMTFGMDFLNENAVYYSIIAGPPEYICICIAIKRGCIAMVHNAE